MKKILLSMFIALTGAAAFTSCSDDDSNSTPVVGITSVTITPAGSAKAYTCAIDQQTLTIVNSADSVDWDVTDAAIANSNVKATATLGASVYVNNQEVGTDGLDVNATAPLTLVARDQAGNSKTYTLRVVKATTASGADMLLKSSTLSGFPANLVDFDVTVFNGKFYAITTSVTKGSDSDTENYQLFTSDDGTSWSEVNYQTDTRGVNLPEGQSAYVIGGEGARLAVFNNRLYVLGGARTLGADKYGNAAESDNWGWGPLKQLNSWRSFSTSDGVTFRCDTVGAKVTNADGTTANPKNTMQYTYLNTATIGNKLFIQGGFTFGFGMAQGARAYAYTTDGINWTKATPTSSDDNCDVARRLGSVFFSFKGKLWCLTGFTNFVSADGAFNKTVYSSSDGLTWEPAGELSNIPNLYHAKVIANDNVAYLIGGEVAGADGSASTLSNKIYRSTDGINWTEVEIPANFTARRNVAGALLGNSAWLFGGYSTTTTGNYGYPYSDTDNLIQDSWIKLMD